MNNMKIKTTKEKIKFTHEAILCILLGTLSGLAVYIVFLYFNIAIFGWNFGLVFAPLAAGYVETILAHKIIGEDIGAISAFILFVYTTFYSFILKNSNLGLNIITIVSVAVILQSAFPTLFNYLIFTVGIGTILYVIGIVKKITRFFYDKLKGFVYKYILKKTPEVKIVEKYDFDEAESNKIINSLDFYFITSTDVLNERIINLGQFHATVIVEKAPIQTPPNRVEFEKKTLYNLKTGKDKCLIRLVNNIKSAGGNGIIDLEIRYTLIGLGGESYQITALGMGIYIS
jgi:hypothetical protein